MSPDANDNRYLNENKDVSRDDYILKLHFEEQDKNNRELERM